MTDEADPAVCEGCGFECCQCEDVARPAHETPPARWNAGAGKQLPSDPHIEAFLDEIERVCRKHGMTISHEDQHGAFQIHGLEEYNINWLRLASDNRVIPRTPR